MPAREHVAVLGAGSAAGAHELRDFLSRIDQPYEWLDPEENAHEASELVGRHGSPERFPLVVIDRREALEAPSLEQLADALGIRYPPTRSEYDLIIIGAGPAGLAAAVYAASDGLRTVVAERGAPGGQASYTARIENYFGLDPLAEPMTGARLARIGGRQAELFGAELLILRGVVDGGRRGDFHTVVLSDGSELAAPAVVCATGVDWRRLEAMGIDDLLGRGVHYGAGRSEAPRFGGRNVAIVGGGNSAGQAALNFAAFADHVTMLCRGEALAASLSRYLLDRIEAHARIDVRLHTRVTAVHGDERLEAVTLEAAGGGEERLPLDGLFIAIGGAPQTQWAERGKIRRDQAGYLLTGSDLLDDGEIEGWPLERTPYNLETSVPGFFVAGDVRHGSTKRVAGAVGEGAMAIALAYRRLEELQRAAGA